MSDETYEPVRALPTRALKDELLAIEHIWGILEALNPQSRLRVLAWINTVFR